MADDLVTQDPDTPELPEILAPDKLPDVFYIMQRQGYTVEWSSGVWNRSDDGLKIIHYYKFSGNGIEGIVQIEEDADA